MDSTPEPNGLAGKRIEFRGLQLTITDVLVRVEMLDGRKWHNHRASLAAMGSRLDASQTWLGVAGAYLRLGIEHIWSGIDHLLFILGLMILVKGTRRLIATVTAFTVAHSITLAGATLGFVHVPQTTGRGLYRFEHRVRRMRRLFMRARAGRVGQSGGLGLSPSLSACYTDSVSPVR